MSPNIGLATAETAGVACSSTTSGSGIEFEPPLACIRRLLKNSLPKSTNVGRDASAAFTRACGIFIIYLTTCANDFAKESKRQTITAADVLSAIKELDFGEFNPQLGDFLRRHRDEERHKKDAKKVAAAKFAEQRAKREDNFAGDGLTVVESSGNAVCDEEMIENRKRKVHNGPTDDKRLNYQEEFANDEEESLVDYDEEDHEDDDVALSIDANS